MRTIAPVSSRHLRTPTYLSEQGRLVLGLRRRAKLLSGDVYIVHPVGDNERLDQISFRYYKTPHLAWVLADVNGLNAPWELGATVKVPTTGAIAGILNRMGRTT